MAVPRTACARMLGRGRQGTCDQFGLAQHSFARICTTECRTTCYDEGRLGVHERRSRRRILGRDPCIATYMARTKYGGRRNSNGPSAATSADLGETRCSALFTGSE
ncbi:hypothetical protein DCS_02432 [Drechmeria coniospora]|uniref:Uncharacterized protein n=1 Tax=Drechmeria coniospora TaxID=98403 RepID=A0A151GW42_DRECN|nr:hypothetical protein DCS_02432 [Drechmeria coniospora]KYK61290.1 hypothetical protein DCS_02432 [Drechmeria coniospora]